tara:strand:- start:253 stop:885 length:633 start_codon:yes stop_codon:yes gene_type:complete
MAISTIGDLKVSVADWLNRSDLSSQIPDFITLALRNVNRQLSIPLQNKESTITPTAFATDLPSDTIYVISVTDSKGRLVEPVTIDEVYNFSSESGANVRYALRGKSILLAPDPGATNTEVYTIVYVADSDFDGDETTSATDTSTINIQDIYLYATLQEAYVYLKDDNRVQYFAQETAKRIADMEARRSRQGSVRGRIKDESISVNGGPLI